MKRTAQPAAQLSLTLSVSESVRVAAEHARMEAYACDEHARAERLAEANTKLQQQVERLKKDNRAWARSYKRRKEECDQMYKARLSDTEHPLHQECTRLREEVDALRLSLRNEVWRALGVRPGGDNVSREALTTLLKLAHPDRWSQGQPATELAHELSVRINQLRGEVRA